MTTVCADLLDNFRHISGVKTLNIDQCIINEYKRAQKITPHIDHIKHFGPVVATVSLGSSMTMRFTRSQFEPYDIVLQAGDVVVLSGDARYKWSHELIGISAEDFHRISITVRSVVG